MLKIDRSVLRAWNHSCLGGLPEDIRDTLLARAVIATVPAGDAVYAAFGAPRFALLAHGRARVQALSEDGRAVTIRYTDPGQVIGLPPTLASGWPVCAQAVTECQVVYLDPATVRRLATTRAELAEVFLQNMTTILFEVIELLTENVFGSVLQRVSRHLVDLAEETPAGLIVQADQHTIADSIGSVREVVARALRKLREDDMITRCSTGILILDRDRMLELGGRA